MHDNALEQELEAQERWQPVRVETMMAELSRATLICRLCVLGSALLLVAQLLVLGGSS